MSRRFTTGLLAAALLLAATGCTAKPAEPSKSAVVPTQSAVPAGDGAAQGEATGDAKYKIAFCMSGSINDSAWCAIAYNELENLATEGHTTTYTENIEAAAIEEALRNYANEGFDIIVGHGFEYGEPALRIADQYPESYFFINGKKPTEDTTIPKNMCFVDAKYHEVTYIMGMIAAASSESGKIGYIAGASNPTQIAGYNAFIAGAKELSPNLDIMAVITGTFTDPAKGQETAIAQIEAGADVITQSASNTGMGAMEAASSRGVKIIGNGSEQEDLFPDLMVATYFIDTQAILQNCVKMMDENRFGDLWRPGLADGIAKVDYLNKDFLSADDLEKIETRIQEIIDGKFVVEENLIYNP